MSDGDPGGSAEEGREFELGAGAGVEPVAPSVSEQVEGKQGEHDSQRGEDDHVRRVEEETTCGSTEKLPERELQ